MASVPAQTEKPQDRARAGGQAAAQQGNDSVAGSTRNLVRASELLGKNIKNREDKSMGEISELAIDIRTGRTAYAVISFGGFLGIGDKLVAVPFQILHPSANGKHMILDVPKEKLEQAPRFDKKEWPDMNDEKWGREIHTFYGVEPYWTGSPLGMAGPDGAVRDGVQIGRDKMVGADDASSMKDKFDRNTLTVVMGKIVSIDRPLGTSVGTEARTGEATRESTARPVEAGERKGEQVNQPVVKADQDKNAGVVQITLRTEGGATGDAKGEGAVGHTAGTGSTIKVLLGPSTFLDTQHLNLAANDQVTVKGSKCDKDGQHCIIATEIRKLDQVVRLRDENGTPLWTGQAATPPAGGRK